MGELGVLFNPGMRHEQAEKLAKQMLREDEGTGRKGRLGIDLESGVVVIGSTSTRSPEQPSEGSPDPDAEARIARPKPAGRPPVDAPDADTSTPHTGSTAARPESITTRPEPAAAPSGKARRRSPAGTAGHTPTGKARRRGR